MWIVKLALRRPYTFVVMSILIVIMGTLSIFKFDGSGNAAQEEPQLLQ